MKICRPHRNDTSEVCRHRPNWGKSHDHTRHNHTVPARHLFSARYPAGMVDAASSCCRTAVESWIRLSHGSVLVRAGAHEFTDIIVAFGHDFRLAWCCFGRWKIQWQRGARRAVRFWPYRRWHLNTPSGVGHWEWHMRCPVAASRLPLLVNAQNFETDSGSSVRARFSVLK